MTKKKPKFKPRRPRLSQLNQRELTEAELEKLAATADDELLSRFPDWTRGYLRSAKAAYIDKHAPETIVDLAEEKHQRDAKVLFLKRTNKALLHELSGLKARLSVLEQIPKTATPGDLVIAPKKAGAKPQAVAVALASDWHAEEPVDPEKVNGLNSYNTEIFRQRAATFFRNVVQLLGKESKEIQIDHLILGLLGDFFTGYIHDDTTESNQLAIVPAAILVQKTLTDGIAYILKNSPVSLTIVCKPGNHGRLTKEHRYKTESETSLEHFIYINLANTFQNEKRIRFKIDTGYHSYIDVFGYVIRFHHGHKIRYHGGQGGITIPVNKRIDKWNRSKHADLDCFGHFHQFFDGGSFIVNGSLIGYNEYALGNGFAYEPPVQAFFLVDSRYGKTVVAPIIVAE